MGAYYTDSHLGSLADIVSPEFHAELPESKEPSVMVLQLPEVTDLLALHGIDAKKQVSEGGRVELRLQSTPVYQSVLHQIIRKTDAKLLVYDSISAPFKASFPNTQDLPARSAGLAMLLAHSQRLCVEFGIAVEVVSHVSIDPIKAWDRRPYGGVILGHEAKFSFELTKGTAKRNSEAEVHQPRGRQREGQGLLGGTTSGDGGVLEVRIRSNGRGGIPLMGWLLKVGALVVGLFSLSLGLWPVSLLCFGYLGYCLWSATRKRRIYVMDKSGGGARAASAAEAWSVQKEIRRGRSLFHSRLRRGRRGWDALSHPLLILWVSSSSCRAYCTSAFGSRA